MRTNFIRVALVLATVFMFIGCEGFDFKPVDTAALKTAIASATELNDSHTVGTDLGNVSQEAKDAFSTVISNAQTVCDDILSTQEVIDAELPKLETATTAFTAAIIQSDNANLSSITLTENGKLNTAFDSTILDYNASVDTAISSVTISGICVDANASVAAVTLSDLIIGERQTASITVTAADKITTKTYTVKVDRAGDYSSAGNHSTMKYVPAGSFQRDSTTENISIISNSFRMSESEVTRLQFKSVMGTDPSTEANATSTNPPGTDPVQMSNWYHAIAFCNKLSLAEGLNPVYTVSTVSDWLALSFDSIPKTTDTAWDAVSADWTANGYRLPTEMEWMWAAMGATGTETNTTGYTKAFAGSTGLNAIANYAWYLDNASTKTHTVAGKTANELGLYDMSGNVWEWNWDLYSQLSPASENYPITGTVTDYRGADSGTTRCIRGGGFDTNASYSTLANRHKFTPFSQWNYFGFRVVRN